MKKSSQRSPIFVVFADTPRIYRNESQIPRGVPYIKDPDLSLVRGLQMHKWTPESFKARRRPIDIWHRIIVTAILMSLLLTAFLAGLLVF